MDDVLDFLILESIYKCSLKHEWNEGDRFRSMIDGSYWTGSVSTWLSVILISHNDRKQKMFIITFSAFFLILLSFTFTLIE